ncbi:SETMR methyltransferase, partial [Acromyrmex insinuator]
MRVSLGQWSPLCIQTIYLFTERKRGGKKDDGNVIVPLRLTKEKKEKHVNLLYPQESRRDDDENVIAHFTWIKDLITRKGVFPYEYIDSVDKLDETSLPSRELFYSSLIDETASDDDYQHATNVWQRFDDIERFDVMSVSSDIMYTDTDNLIYLLECKNVYENIKRDIARFDTSDYPERNAYDVPRANNKIPRLMKDENNGAIMTEFIGLRAKMYALRVIGKSDMKRIKGIKKKVHLFTKLKESLAGKRFQSDEEVQTAVTNWTKELAGSFYAEGISKLVSRYTKCIEIDGNYIEKD